MEKIQNNEFHTFLKGGGEMGRLVRDKDWSKTSLNTPSSWTQTFRVCINLMLHSKSPIILMWGEELTCLYNNAYLESLGSNVNRNQEIGSKAIEFWGDAWKIVGPSILKVKEGGESTWNENQLLSIFRNGQLEDAYWTYGFNPVIDEHGMVAGVMTIITETTFVIKAKLKLIESEDRFRKIAEGSSVMIAMADKSKNAIYFNYAWTHFSGMTSDELKNYGWTKIIHPTEKEAAVKDYIDHMERNEIWKADLQMLDSSGKYRWIAAYFTPRFADDGSFDGAISSSIDIHERKLLSNDLEAKIKLRTNELEKSNLKLEKSNDELQSFAYISSHDLQEPLRKIQTFVSQIMDNEFDNLSEKGQFKLRRIESSAERMQNLIQDLLAYSRTDNFDLKFQTLKFESFLEDILIDIDEDLRENDVDLLLKTSCEIDVIPIQFKQLVYNLLTNAIKFRRKDIKSVIEISAEKIKGDFIDSELADKDLIYSKVTISDNGIGFDPMYASKIFDVFQRLHDKTSYKGTGIGLAIVKKITENHKGFVTAHGELNKGATFCVYIPN